MNIKSRYILFPFIIITRMIVNSMGWSSAEWIDLKKIKGSKVNSIEPPRSGHVTWKSKDGIYTFGGYAEEILKENDTGGEDATMMKRYPTNDLFKWNDKDGGWIQVLKSDLLDDTSSSSKSNAIHRRQRLASAASVLYNKRPYIFGGWDSGVPGTGGEILNDIITYDTDQSKFHQLIPTSNNEELDFLPTSRHVAVTIADDTILLHTHRCDDHVLLAKSNTDNKDDGMGSNNNIQITKQRTTGIAPSSRGLHAACKLDDENLIVFGGAAQDGTMSNEVFCLNLNKWHWDEIKITGGGQQGQQQQPSPRASPCFVKVDDNTLILFGGAERDDNVGLKGCDDTWMLQIRNNGGKKEGHWKLLECSEKPPGRNAATLTPLDAIPTYLQNGIDDNDNDDDNQNSAKYFILQGGWAPFVKTYNDVYVLKVL